MGILDRLKKSRDDEEDEDEEAEDDDEESDEDESGGGGLAGRFGKIRGIGGTAGGLMGKVLKRGKDDDEDEEDDDDPPPVRTVPVAPPIPPLACPRVCCSWAFRFSPLESWPGWMMRK